MPIRTELTRGVAVVEIDNPPVNALSCATGLVTELVDAIVGLSGEPGVRAIVVCGRGRMFSAGADISEFGEDPAREIAPIRALAVIDTLAVPVVAAIQGIAFGGGLELALACHHRVCLERTRFAFPEVVLGLLPGAGGTQRATRLVGAGPALDLMLSGAPIDAGRALELGLVDEIVETDVVGAAVVAALRLAGSGVQPRRARDIAITRDAAADAAIAAGRAAAEKTAGRGEAPRSIVACVEAAFAMDFDTALDVEYRVFDALVTAEASRGLRHAFLMDGQVGRVPGLPAPSDRTIATVAVVGAGTMGIGIATCCLNAGLAAILIDRDQATCIRARAAIEKNLESAVTRGRSTAGEAAERLGRLVTETGMAAGARADLWIEAVYEDLALKQEIFRTLDSVAAPHAILATNTSTLDVEQIADCVVRPERVIGMHFFSPAHIMKLLEIVRGRRTDPAIVADVLALSRRLGKVGVVAGVCDGFIGNRIFEEYLRQAYFLLEEGALPGQVDGAMEAFGFAMGPLRVMDLAGQDIGWNIRKRRAVEQPDRPYSRIPDLLCEQGRFGQKSGAGYYLYPQGVRRPVSDPAIDAMVVAHSASIGIERREISDDEIVSRCLLAMVNEGARVLADGIASRPLEIDAVYVHGYGFPAWRGGPMFHADRIGLRTVLARIEAFARGCQGWTWEPSPLLVDLAMAGRSFGSLDR